MEHKWYISVLKELSLVLCERCLRIVEALDDSERDRIIRDFVADDGCECFDDKHQNDS